MVEYDTPYDLKLDSNREIVFNNSGDLALVEGADMIAQSTMVDAGSVVRPLVGEPITSSTLKDVEAELKRSFNRDPYLDDDVLRVEVDTIYKDENRVSVIAQTSANDEFQVSIDA